MCCRLKRRNDFVCNDASHRSLAMIVWGFAEISSSFLYTDRMKKVRSFAEKIFLTLAGTFRDAPVVYVALFVLAVLLPLVYVPGIAELFSPLKHALLVVSVAIGLFGWSIHVYRQRAWTLRHCAWIWLPVLVLIGVIVSAIRSPSGYVAWVGIGSLSFTSVIPLFAFVGLYALVVHVGDHR